MPRILLIKTGDTFPKIKAAHGDFDEMIAACSTDSSQEITVYDARKQSIYPELSDFSGVIITGSHSMVTDEEPWSEKLLPYIREMYEREIPVLGICYGHQLITKAMGGSVGYRKQGIQSGTVSVELTDEAQLDPIFSQLPPTFSGNVGHSQAATTLPEGAVLLAHNHREPHEAIRLGKAMWGIQFHPEFTQAISRQYIELSNAEIESSKQDPKALWNDCTETPVSQSIISRFIKYAGESDRSHTAS